MIYIIDFSYSGENFSGYQKQPGLRTVEEEIEKVLTMINNNKVTIVSSGRTDKNVNALHQIAHFNLNIKLSEYKLKGALNSYLPDDIYINSVTISNDTFHARYNVKSKVYEYLINTKNYNPLNRNFIYQYGKDLDIESMIEASNYLVGTHDYTSFVCSEYKKENKVRTIYDIKIKKNKGIVSIKFHGTGFMKYQVRNMVGLLIRVGEGLEKPIIAKYVLEARDRRKAFKTAPACGLTLIKVNYK